MNKCIPVIARKDGEVRNRTGLEEPGACSDDRLSREGGIGLSLETHGVSQGCRANARRVLGLQHALNTQTLTRPSPNLCFSGSSFRKQKNKLTQCGKKGQPIRP